MLPIVNFEGRYRQSCHTYPCRVKNRVADCWRYCRNGVLCRRLSVKRSRAGNCPSDQGRLTIRNVANIGNFVLTETQRPYPPIVDDNFFTQRHTESLYHPALDLSLVGETIDHH